MARVSLPYYVVKKGRGYFEPSRAMKATGARAVALEIEAARVHLDEARGDPSYTLDDIEDLKAELHHLEREFSLTGVTSEYDL